MHIDKSRSFIATLDRALDMLQRNSENCRPTAKRYYDLPIMHQRERVRSNTVLSEFTQLTCVPADSQPSFLKGKKKKPTDFDGENGIFESRQKPMVKKTLIFDKDIANLKDPGNKEVEGKYANRKKSSSKLEKKFCKLVQQGKEKPKKTNQVILSLKDCIKRMQFIKKEERKQSFIKSFSKSPDLSRCISQKLLGTDDSRDEISRFKPFRDKKSKAKLTLFNRKMSEGRLLNHRHDSMYSGLYTELEASREYFESAQKPPKNNPSNLPQKTITM